MAVARDLAGEAHNVIAVIGDGAMSAGMAYEAMNNAGAMDSRLIVILNDNDMSIAPPVGAMSAYLARLVSGRTYRSLRDIGKQLAKQLPKFFERSAQRAEEYARGLCTGGTLFEELGFYYVGPIDGHNLDHLLPVLKNVRDAENGPILVHVVTQKGKGYAPAEASTDKYHGVVKFDVATGKQVKAKVERAVLHQGVRREPGEGSARRTTSIVAITAAMPSRHGRRHFRQGISGSHLRCRHRRAARASPSPPDWRREGYKPFAAIYSTFLQRAYDQVVHDVAHPAAAGALRARPRRPRRRRRPDACRLVRHRLSRLPARFRAHGGGRRGRARSHGRDRRRDRRPSVRVALSARRRRRRRHAAVGVPLEIGKGRIITEGNTVALLSLGTRLAGMPQGGRELAAHGLSTTVADARFAKPLDTDLVLRLAREHEVLITVEEGAIGGFGSLRDADCWPSTARWTAAFKVRSMVLPDVFIDHDSPDGHVRQGRASTPRHRREGVRGARSAARSGIAARRDRGP